jgi:ribosomal-protein-serine acetyltransferase
MFEATVDEGLVLRLLEPRHAGALSDLIDRNRDHLSAWFPWVEGTKTVEDSRAFIRSQLEKFVKDDGFQLGIWLNGELVGTVGLNYILSQFRCTEIGYWLGSEYEGRGVMMRACRYLCGYLFDELNLNRIEIRCAETNTKSRAIPERLGFTLEGKLRQLGYTRDGLVDYLVYGALADEWQKETR